MLHVLKYNGIEIAKNIEFARTAISRMLGLMFRRSIHDDFAMIFVVKKKTDVSVHMLFVFFPIDVVFLNDEKKISGFSRLVPWTGYKTMKNVKYVIEMRAGTIEKNKLAIGGQMEFGDD